MSVYTISGTGNDEDELESEPASEIKRVYPNVVVSLAVISPDRSTNSIKGTWARPFGLISGYRIECISSTGGDGHNKDLDSDTTEYTCTGLSAGHFYTMSVHTVSGTGHDDDKLESEPVSGDKRVYPNVVVALAVHSPDRSTTSIKAKWVRPFGLISSYTIECISSTGGVPRFAHKLNSYTTAYTCTGLSAGHLYMMSVYTASGTENDDEKLESEPASKVKRVCKSGGCFGLNRDFPREIDEFPYWIMDKTNSLISSYRVECTSSTGGNPYEGEYLDSNFEYDCTGLSAGHLYTMSVYTVSGTGNGEDKLESEPASKVKRVYPEHATVLTTATTHDSFIITWTQPDGHSTGYTFTYEPIDNRENAKSGNEEILDLDQAITSHAIGGLYAGTKYSVDLFTKSGQDGDTDPLQGDPETETDRTMPDTPGNFRIANKTVASLLAAWDKPTGKLESYSIAIDFVNEERDKTLDNVHIPLPDKDDENPASNITGLDPFTEYRLTLTCLSPEPMRTECDPTYIEEKTDIAPPPPSDVRPSNDPEVIMKTKTTITVEFTDDIFIHDYGPVLYYSVIVTEENVTGGYYDYQPERGTDPDPQMNTWAKAQGRTLRYK
ncbi:fibronectin-like [Ptychodera flava]|uniref:fibronectin-like n=1 Tax=Ptychodera flava TaxID=63121 RepID=UPI00396A1349